LLYTVRVRGIYATALSWLLSRRGFLLADVSEVLKRRLPQPPSQRAPDVTVKTVEDDPDYVLVLGYPWEAGEQVYNVILEETRYNVRRQGRLGLYTVVDLVSEGDCWARGPGGVRVRLDHQPCPPPGEKLRATIVREALEKGAAPVARPGVRVVGQYVIVSMPGDGVSYSEHIRDDDLKLELLLALAGKVDTKKAHVRFRSSSRLAPPETVAAEAGQLYQEAQKLLGEEPGDPRLVRRGEFIALIGFPRPAKTILDGIRREVVPTLRGHHTLKSFGDKESNLVDCAEETGSGEEHGEKIELYLARRMVGMKVRVQHSKPDGGKLLLGPFHVKSAVHGRQGIEMVLERVFTRPGVLDGLGVEKRPGDRAVTRLWTGTWYLVHEYISQEGNLIGVYGNVNTPPEVGSGRIKYFDLYIDVVKKPGEEARIIDREELEEAYREGFISETVYREALATAEYLARLLNSEYP